MAAAATQGSRDSDTQSIPAVPVSNRFQPLKDEIYEPTKTDNKATPPPKLNQSHSQSADRSLQSSDKGSYVDRSVNPKDSHSNSEGARPKMNETRTDTDTLIITDSIGRGLNSRRFDRTGNTYIKKTSAWQGYTGRHRLLEQDKHRPQDSDYKRRYKQPSSRKWI